MATRCQEQRPRKRSPSISAGASHVLEGARWRVTAALSLVITQRDSTLGWMEFARMRVCNTGIESNGILIDDYKKKWQICIAKVIDRSQKRLTEFIDLFISMWKMVTDNGGELPPHILESDTEQSPPSETSSEGRRASDDERDWNYFLYRNPIQAAQWHNFLDRYPDRAVPMHIWSYYLRVLFLNNGRVYNEDWRLSVPP